MKKLIITAFLANCIFVANAQSFTLSGTVVDEKRGEPSISTKVELIGIEGVTTITNFDGKFTITSPDITKYNTLLLTTIGDTLEYQINPKKNDVRIVIKTKPFLELNEVVILGGPVKCKEPIDKTKADSIVYLIFTSQTLNGKIETQLGIRKWIKADSLDKTPYISFNMISKSKKIRERFMHLNRDVEKIEKLQRMGKLHNSMSKDQMEVLIKPYAFLDSIKPIDLDEIFPCMTKEEAEKFACSMRNRKIYVIDRNDMTPDSIKLIQVEYYLPMSF